MSKYVLRNGQPTRASIERMLAPMCRALHEGTYRRRFRTGINLHGFHIKAEKLLAPNRTWTPHFLAYSGDRRIEGPIADVVSRLHATITGASDASA